jgi:hypothetical protein
LTPKSNEILCELWAVPGNNDADVSLGVGIVSVEELLANPRQRHEVTLLAKPEEESGLKRKSSEVHPLTISLEVSLQNQFGIEMKKLSCF